LIFKSVLYLFITFKSASYTNAKVVLPVKWMEPLNSCNIYKSVEYKKKSVTANKLFRKMACGNK